MHCLTSWLGPCPHAEAARLPKGGAAERPGMRACRRMKDERLYSPSCFETHRSTPWVVETVAFVSRRDAPRHEAEGEGGIWPSESEAACARTVGSKATCTCDGR